MNEVLATAGEGNNLTPVAIGLTADFKQPIAWLETGREGLMFQVADGEQVVVHLEGHAGVFAAVRQLLEGSCCLHDVKGHARDDEEAEGEIKEPSCGLAGHLLSRGRRMGIRSVFIIARQINQNGGHRGWYARPCGPVPRENVRW